MTIGIITYASLGLVTLFCLAVFPFTERMYQRENYVLSLFSKLRPEVIDKTLFRIVNFMN